MTFKMSQQLAKTRRTTLLGFHFVTLTVLKSYITVRSTICEKRVFWQNQENILQSSENIHKWVKQSAENDLKNMSTTNAS